MPEIIVLVDEKDNPIGYEEKLSAHRNGGKLHRAFSIFIFPIPQNEALLQLSRKQSTTSRASGATLVAVIPQRVRNWTLRPQKAEARIGL